MASVNAAAVSILDSGDGCPSLPLVESGGGKVTAVVWPGVGASSRSINKIHLRGEVNTVVLRHPMEAVYYVVDGSGVVRNPETHEQYSVAEGSMIHIEPATPYQFVAGSAGVNIVGGPCPHDPTMYRSVN